MYGIRRHKKMVLKVGNNEWLHYQIFLATQNDQKNIVLQGRSFKTFECQKASFQQLNLILPLSGNWKSPAS